MSPMGMLSFLCTKHHETIWVDDLHEKHRLPQLVATLHKSEFYADAKSELSNFQSFGIIWVCHGLSKNDVYHGLSHIFPKLCLKWVSNGCHMGIKWVSMGINYQTMNQC